MLFLFIDAYVSLVLADFYQRLKLHILNVLEQNGELDI
jgi:hypothetical protein